MQPGPYEGEISEEEIWNRLFYGDPARVTEKFRRLAGYGATFAGTWMMLGEIKHETVIQSIRLMGERVIPALRYNLPPTDLPQRMAGVKANHDVLRSIPLAPSD